MVVGLTILGVVLATVGLAISIAQNLRLLLTLGLGTEGTIVFWQKLTIKVWLELYLLLVLISSLKPGGLPLEWRRYLSLALVVLLLGQIAFEVATNHRWRNQPPAARRKGAIPDLGDER